MTLEELLALLPDNNTGAIDAADLRIIVTDLYTRDDAADSRLDALEADTAALGVQLDALEADVTTLQSDLLALKARVDTVEGQVVTLDGRLDTAEAQIVVNDGRIDELEISGDGYAQVFSYLWATTAGPAVGKVTTNAWSMAANQVQVNETTDDGQTLTFAVMAGASRAEISIYTADGKHLKANVTGPTVDMGAYRNIPIAPFEVVGAAPALNAKVTVAIIVWP